MKYYVIVTVWGLLATAFGVMNAIDHEMLPAVLAAVCLCVAGLMTLLYPSH